MEELLPDSVGLRAIPSPGRNKNAVRYRYRNAHNGVDLPFNIGIDLATLLSIFIETIEVFTSVPPDPVSIVHCRHWVVFFPEPPPRWVRAATASGSRSPAGRSKLRSCKWPRPPTSFHPGF